MVYNTCKNLQTNLINKLRMFERMCTPSGERIHQYVHWCPIHPSSVHTSTCIGVDDTCLVYAAKHCTMKLLLTIWESWNLFSSTTKKTCDLNHDDTVAEVNIHRRACWFNNSNCRAALAPHLCRISHVFSPTSIGSINNNCQLVGNSPAQSLGS